MKAAEVQAQSSKPTNSHSCDRCFRRKVKCDKQLPCSACVRHNAECVFRVPVRPRARKERPPEDALIKRIQHYEELLRQAGVDPESLPGGPPALSRPAQTIETPLLSTPQSLSGAAREPDKPQLVYKHGRSRYLDNNLWNRVIDVAPDAGDPGYSSAEENDQAEVAEDRADFMFDLTPTPANVKGIHPSPEHILELWQLFVENINSLLKIVHEPTLEIAIMNASADLDNIPRNLEALMFSIYGFVVMSLTEADCEERFNEPRRILLARYRMATKAALSRAKLLSTGDLVVLQAFLLHLFSMRNVYDPQTIWTLMGIAGRLAEGMGLHRDGTYLGLPPFETEIRRRVWWQMKMLDFLTADLVGSAKFKDASLDPQLTRLPSNVNDDQLYPGMTAFPVEPQGATDMCFCSLHSELGHFWSTHVANMRAKSNHDPSLSENFGSNDDTAGIELIIDQLEQILENKYVRYCDPTQPAQLMTFVIARCAINKGRFLAHHPRRWSREEDVPESERQYVWSLAIKLLEAEITIRSSRQLDRFAWHTSSGFAWAQVIHILDYLRTNPFLPDAIKAWRLIGEVFEYRPELIFDKKPLNVALGNLCLKAYNAREAAISQQGKHTGRNPNYIARLRSQRQAAKARRRDVDEKHQRSDASHPKAIASAETSTSENTEQSDTTQVSSTSRITPAETEYISTRAAQPPVPQWHSNDGQSQIGHEEDDYSWHPADIGSSHPGPSTDISDPMVLDIDYLLEQESYLDEASIQPLDWNQWDTLLRDWDGSFTGS